MTAKSKNPGTISVSGTGRVAIEPDVAEVRLGINISRKTIAEARSEAASTMDAILGAVADAGVPKGDVQSSFLSVQPRYDYRDGRPPELSGYEMNNVVTVTVRDMAKLGDVIDGTLQRRGHEHGWTRIPAGRPGASRARSPYPRNGQRAQPRGRDRRGRRA